MRSFCFLLTVVLLWVFSCGLLAQAAPSAPASTAQKKQARSKKEAGKAGAKKNADSKKAGKTASGAGVKKKSASTESGGRKKKTVHPRDWSLDSVALPEDMELPRNIVPVSVRGIGPHFERTLEASLFSDDEWLLPNMGEAEVFEALARFSPTFVHGGIRLGAGSLPSHETVLAWHDLRTALQKANSLVGFDVVIDLRRYASPDEVTGHMHKAGALLTAEAWTFLGAEQVAASNPAVLRAAVAEAHAQGRTCGGVGFAGSAGAANDYSLAPYGSGGQKFISRVETAAKNGAEPEKRAGAVRKPSPLPVIIVSGEPSLAPGEGFARGKTPAQRRLMVMAAAKMQRPGLSFAYPVFGPMASQLQAYNSLRDEFMYDTIGRSIREYNPVPPVSSLTDATAKAR